MNTDYINHLFSNASTLQLLRLEDDLSRATVGHTLRCRCLSCAVAIEINVQAQQRSDYAEAVKELAAYLKATKKENT